MEKKYIYIAFDLDGTLMNTYEGIANGLCYVAEHFGMEKPDEKMIGLFIGPPLEDTFKKHYGFDEEKTAEAVAKFREFYGPIGQNQCKPYDGIKETLQKLNDAGYKLFVATSKLIGPAKGIVERFGLSEYFCHIEGTPLGMGDCSKADILLAAFGALNIKDKREVVLIGDTRFDAIGAAKVGIDCLGVSYGFGTKEELEENNVFAVAESPADILNFF